MESRKIEKSVKHMKAGGASAAPPNPQASVLRRELAALEKQSIFESHRRGEAEQALQREQRAAIAPEHAAAMLRREEEIRRIREEKEAMTEWLHRGVAEASRIAEQIDLLRDSQTQTVATEQDLKQDNDKLFAMEKQLQRELEEVKAKLVAVREHRDILESESLHVSQVVGAATEVISDVIKNKLTLEEETENLKLRMRDCEVIEIAVSCSAAAVRRTLHELERLYASTSRGEHVEDSDDDEDYDSGDDGAGGTVFPPAQLASSRANVARCDTLLETLWSCLSRFGSDQSVREIQKRRNHQDLVKEMQTELQDLKERSDFHIKQQIDENRRREPLLRRYIQLRNERTAAVASELAGSTGPVPVEQFNLLRELEKENDGIAEQRDATFAEFKQYKSRADSVEADYRAVKEMKRLYRELETQKTMLSHEIRSAEQENKSMKLLLWGNAPTRAVSAAKVPGSTEKKKWRAVPSQY